MDFCKKKLRFLRKLGHQTVCDYLHEAGLKYLTRRAKRWVAPEAKVMRKAYAKWLLLLRQRRMLDRFAYTDRTTFFLARSPQESSNKKRAALGKFVWRMSSGKDGLYDDNISPSIYIKGRGLPVKIWGLFAAGRLEYWVLPQDPDNAKKTTHMNGGVYNGLLNEKFAEWRRKCFHDDSVVHLVQDWEKCLWQKRNLGALRRAGFQIVENYPKSSPDLNAIEGMWNLVRQKLQKTEPTEFENRTQFLARLRLCVNWLNEKLLTVAT